MDSWTDSPAAVAKRAPQSAHGCVTGLGMALVSARRRRALHRATYPPGEHHVLTSVLEGDLDCLADLNRGGIDLVDLAVRRGQEVADKADRGVLVELHDDHVVGRQLHEGGEE